MSAVKAPPRAAILVAASLLVGCSGGERLSAAMASINREYGTIQDEALLLNILRRSASLPAHFTSLSIIRGRSRVTAGANLTVPFGGDAPARFDFNPHLSIEQGPSFEVSTQDNQEFYRGYSSPVDTTTIDYYLRQDHPKELILSLFLNRIRIDGPGGEEAFVNTPDQQGNYEGFQNLLGRLVDQGLTTVQAPVARHVGPELSMQQPPSLEQILSLQKEGLAIEEVSARRYQIMQVSESARFCFARPHEPLFEKARCETGSTKGRRFAVSDPEFFGSAGGTVAFAWEGLGSIELQTRSPAEILDYLGELVRIQQSTATPPTIRTVSGPQPMLVVMPDPSPAPAAVTAEFAGVRHAVPGGAAGGQSGAVLSIISQLLAQAQSVKDLPVSNTVTIIGD